MTLAEKFTVDFASVIGRLHVSKHVNNQDSYNIIYTDDIFIGVVSDGCSGSPHSEVGSYLTTTYLAKSIGDRLPSDSMEIFDPVDLMEDVRIDTALFLRGVASQLGRPTEFYLQNAMLATASGFVMTPTIAFVFSIGDGVFFVNGEEIELSNEQAQYPDMLVYGVMNPQHLKITPQEKFNVKVYDPASIESILVGTDGFRYVIQSEGLPIPGTRDPVPPLTEIIDGVDLKPLLRKMGREVRKARYDAELDIATQDVHRSLLLDDTTAILLRRNKDGLSQT